MSKLLPNSCLVLSTPPKKETFVSASKNANYTFPVVPCFTWKLELFWNVLWVIVWRKSLLLLTNPTKLQVWFSWQFLYISQLWHSFNLKLKQLICKKVLKFVLLDSYFPDHFTELQIWNWKYLKFRLGRFLERWKKFHSNFRNSILEKWRKFQSRKSH